MKTVLSKSIQIAGFLILVAACQNKPAGTGFMGDLSKQSGSPFDSQFHSDLNTAMGGNGNTGGSVGSGSTGNLTDADKQALAGMTKGMEDVNAKDGGLSQNLIDEAKRILDAENNNDGDAEGQANIQQMKMALVGKIIEQCAEKVAPKAPKPGQPLMGVWQGSACGGVNFTVAATADAANYTVTGSTKGRMIAAADGTAEVQGEPFRGNLTDSPQAGTGTLVHPTFNETKAGKSPCSVGVRLQKSTNPIPENYIEAMKQLGKCHRQALLFMSPVMDKMFRNMPSNLSSVLLGRGFGISR